MKDFFEWYAESEDISKKMAKALIRELFTDIILHPYHKGDCTKDSEPCVLCMAEILLSDYYKYMKDEMKSNE